MVSRSRSSKRKRTAEEPEHPQWESETSNPTMAEKVHKPSGHPFIDEDVKWRYERLNLLSTAKEVIPAGYEGLAGEVNGVLKSLTIPKADRVRNSSMGQFTRLDSLTTRCGKLLHFMVCHQVVPEPNFDLTSLFFKIGDKALRFSRIKYALVSRLKFRPTVFNPYADHPQPPDSTFERLFGANPKQ